MQQEIVSEGSTCSNNLEFLVSSRRKLTRSSSHNNFMSLRVLQKELYETESREQDLHMREILIKQKQQDIELAGRIGEALLQDIEQLQQQNQMLQKQLVTS